MIKDLTVIVDGLTQKAGRYALSLTSLFDAHLTAISAVVEPAIPPAAPIPAALRSSRRRGGNATEARNIVDRIKTEGHRECLQVNSLALDRFDDAGLDKLDRMTRLFDIVIMGRLTRRIRRAQAQGRGSSSGLADPAHSALHSARPQA